MNLTVIFIFFDTTTNKSKYELAYWTFDFIFSSLWMHTKLSPSPWIVWESSVEKAFWYWIHRAIQTLIKSLVSLSHTHSNEWFMQSSKHTIGTQYHLSYPNFMIIIVHTVAQKVKYYTYLGGKLETSLQLQSSGFCVFWCMLANGDTHLHS